MAEGNSQIFQFRVDIKRFKPPIWRRIQIPADFNFKDLHLAIQCAFGWSNMHLYVFIMGYKKIPIPNSYSPIPIYEKEPIRIGRPRDCDIPGLTRTLSAKNTKLSEYFPHEKSKGVYEYDLGSTWEHDVVLEKILPRIEGMTYPRCAGGRMATPPEEDPVYRSDSEEDEEEPDPTIFDYKAVKFDRFFF